MRTTLAENAESLQITCPTTLSTQSPLLGYFIFCRKKKVDRTLSEITGIKSQTHSKIFPSTVLDYENIEHRTSYN